MYTPLDIFLNYVHAYARYYGPEESEMEKTAVRTAGWWTMAYNDAQEVLVEDGLWLCHSICITHHSFVNQSSFVDYFLCTIYLWIQLLCQLISNTLDVFE